MALLGLKEIRKSYTNKVAVDGISFSVGSDDIFGLLGPNGAGKSTLIRIITNIIASDSGQVLFEGQPLRQEHQHIIGYMPEERGLYKKMKVGEQLTYLARLKGLSASDAKKRIEYWMEKFDIADWWGKKIEELSKGMQQKIQFISTVVHEPRLLILDEPFSGLDPINTNLIKEEIYELHQKGTSVIFSTHRMEQVEEICREIVLVNNGKKVLEGKVTDIKQQFKENIFHLEFYDPIPADLNAQTPFEITIKSEKVAVAHLSEEHDPNFILKFFVDQGISIKAFKEILPSINQIFIQQVSGVKKEVAYE